MTYTLILQISILAIVCFIFVYTIIDRICKCIEQVATVKQYGKLVENGGKSISTPSESNKGNA